MNKHIPNLLLAVATATGALSAASARLPWRMTDLQPGVEQDEYLAYDVKLGDEVKALKGARLDAELTTTLSSLGFTTVKVRSPAHPSEVLALAEAKGHVLADALLIPGKTEEIGAGRIVDPALEAHTRILGWAELRKSHGPEFPTAHSASALEKVACQSSSQT